MIYRCYNTGFPPGIIIYISFHLPQKILLSEKICRRKTISHSGISRLQMPTYPHPDRHSYLLLTPIPTGILTYYSPPSRPASLPTTLPHPDRHLYLLLTPIPTGILTYYSRRILKYFYAH